MTGYSNSPKILKGGIVLIDAESGRVLRIISLGSMGSDSSGSE